MLYSVAAVIRPLSCGIVVVHDQSKVGTGTSSHPLKYLQIAAGVTEGRRPICSCVPTGFPALSSTKLIAGIRTKTGWLPRWTKETLTKRPDAQICGQARRAMANRKGGGSTAPEACLISYESVSMILR